QFNQALGGKGGLTFHGTQGGNGLGGGLYVAGGTASLSNVTVSSNTAQGGDGSDAGFFYDFDRRAVPVPGGNGGNGLGGGLYAAGGTVSLHGTTVQQNTAAAGAGGKSFKYARAGNPGLGEGGGLYLEAAALACLDAFTQANVKHNKAST